MQCVMTMTDSLWFAAICSKKKKKYGSSIRTSRPEISHPHPWFISVNPILKYLMKKNVALPVIFAAINLQLILKLGRQRANSLEKTLMLGKIESRRRREQQRIRRLDGITSSMDMDLGNPRTGKDREAWHAAVHGVTKSQTWLSDWTTKCQIPILVLHLVFVHSLLSSYVKWWNCYLEGSCVE